MRWAATRPGADIHDAGERVGPVQRRTRTAHEFDAFRVDDRHVFQKCRRVTLEAGGIAKPHAVDQNGGVLRTKAARLDADGTARTFELFDTDSRKVPYRVSN